MANAIRLHGALAGVILSSAAHAQLSGSQFYLLRSDGLLYSGRFGTNVSRLLGDTGLGPNPGGGGGLASELAFDARGRLFALGGTADSAVDARLVRIDTATWASTTVTDIDSFTATSLAIGHGDLAYVYENNLVDQYVVTIDLSTGDIVNRIRQTNPSDPTISAWTVRSDGLLFGAGFGTNDFYTIDPTTGAIEALGLSFASEYNIYGFATSGDTTYFGVDNRATDAYDVYSVDLFTGETAFETSIVDDGAAPGTVRGFTIIPVPMTPTPLLAGMLIAARRRR